MRGEAAHDGGVLDVHPLEDALRQLPVLGRLLKGGLSDSQVERILNTFGQLVLVLVTSHYVDHRIGAYTLSMFLWDRLFRDNILILGCGSECTCQYVCLCEKEKCF